MMEIKRYINYSVLFAPMRVCLIASYPPKNSGIANYSANLYGELSKLAKVRVFKWTYEGIASTLLSPLKNLRELKRVLRDYDVVHVQYVLGEYMFLFLPILCLLRKKAKLVLTLHEDYTNLRLAPLFVMFHNIFYSCADLILVHTRQHRQVLSRRLRKRTIVIPFGITPEKSKKKVRKNTMLLVGFINPWKGHDLAIKAIDVVRKDVPSAKLIIAGKPYDKKYTSRIHGLVRSLHLEKNVEFHKGFIPDKEFKKLFETSEILLLPYRRITMSAVASDVLGYAKPAIFSNIPALVDFTDRKAVYFRKGDHKDLARKMAALLKDKKKKQSIQKEFRRLAERNSWKNVAKKHMSLYEGV